MAYLEQCLVVTLVGVTQMRKCGNNLIAIPCAIHPICESGKRYSPTKANRTVVFSNLSIGTSDTTVQM